MQRAVSMLIVIGLSAGASAAPAQDDVCRAFAGAVIINSDDEFIGTIGTGSDGIYNEYGRYGNQYASASIWNEYGKNGSEYRSGSAFNSYASEPPRIIKDRQVVGHLSTNKLKQGAINPIVLGAVCFDFKPPR